MSAWEVTLEAGPEGEGQVGRGLEGRGQVPSLGFSQVEDWRAETGWSMDSSFLSC